MESTNEAIAIALCFSCNYLKMSSHFAIAISSRQFILAAFFRGAIACLGNGEGSAIVNSPNNYQP